MEPRSGGEAPNGVTRPREHATVASIGGAGVVGPTAAARLHLRGETHVKKGNASLRKGSPLGNYQPRPLSTWFMSVSPRWNLPRFSDRIDQCRSVVSCEAAEVWGVMTRFGAVHSGSPTGSGS